jgi:hypothetical protein
MSIHGKSLSLAKLKTFGEYDIAKHFLPVNVSKNQRMKPHAHAEICLIEFLHDLDRIIYFLDLEVIEILH